MPPGSRNVRFSARSTIWSPAPAPPWARGRSLTASGISRTRTPQAIHRPRRSSSSFVRWCTTAYARNPAKRRAGARGRPACSTKRIYSTGTVAAGEGGSEEKLLETGHCFPGSPARPGGPQRGGRPADEGEGGFAGRRLLEQNEGCNRLSADPARLHFPQG